MTRDTHEGEHRPIATGAKVVVVGAGPVGLWTAIQLLKREPALDVVLLERHEAYARSHVLRLDHWSMLLYGKAALNEREGAFCKEVSGKSFGAVAGAPAKSLYIRTNDLEAALKAYALDLGARIEYAAIATPTDAMERHPDAAIFVAADGAKSRMREALMPGSLKSEELQRVVEIKYLARGKGGSMAVAGDHYKTAKMMSFMAFEYVGKPRDGVYPVTLRLFVDKACYEGLPEASFKAPLDLASPAVPEALRADVALYMAARGQSCGESAVEGSSKATKLILSSYASDEFSARVGPAAWFLAGDAAMGVPYFRALNSGMMLSSRLAQILGSAAKDDAWGSPAMLAGATRRYERHRRAHVATEFGIAKAKNAVLIAYNAWRKASASKPWQAIKWGPEQERVLNGAREMACAAGADPQPELVEDQGVSGPRPHLAPPKPR